jgi:Arc/MetJ-type ribon-helix-helix transcriptional regulator
MIKKIVIPRKKRGPPATGKGEPVVVRMHPPMLAALDRWISEQKPPFPSRPEAVRRLLELVLKAKAKC